MKRLRRNAEEVLMTDINHVKEGTESYNKYS
jgi:hypothetical protein